MVYWPIINSFVRRRVLFFLRPKFQIAIPFLTCKHAFTQHTTQTKTFNKKRIWKSLRDLSLIFWSTHSLRTLMHLWRPKKKVERKKREKRERKKKSWNTLCKQIQFQFDFKGHLTCFMNQKAWQWIPCYHCSIMLCSLSRSCSPAGSRSLLSDDWRVEYLFPSWQNIKLLNKVARLFAVIIFLTKLTESSVTYF